MPPERLRGAIIGYGIGLVLALVIVSLITTTFLVGMVIGAGLTFVGFYAGMALS